MNTVTPETLPQLVWQNHKVITTELLAQCYDTDTNNIRQNYTRNTNRFEEGKHFFKVEGDDLNNLRVTLSHSQNADEELQISSKVRTLMLWTEKGAVRHAKILDTDKAWDVQERLEEAYFHPERRVDSIAQQAQSTAYLDEVKSHLDTQKRITSLLESKLVSDNDKNSQLVASLRARITLLENAAANHKRAIQSWMEGNGRAVRAQRRITAKEEQQIFELYQKGWAIDSLAAHFYRKAHIVKRAIRNQGGAL